MGDMPTISLESPVSILIGVGPKKKELLNQAGISTIKDLLLFLPYKYLDATQITPIAHLQLNQVTTIKAKVVKHFVAGMGKNQQSRSFYSRKSFILITIADKTGTLSLTFFNQPYVVKTLEIGKEYLFLGKISAYKNRLSLTNPVFEPVESKNSQVHLGRIIPIYSQANQLSTRWLRQILYQILFSLEVRLPEYLTQHFSNQKLKAEKIMPREEAGLEVHFPSTLDKAFQARRRLAFDELWEVFLQLARQKAKRQQQPAAAIIHHQQSLNFLKDFQQVAPFKLTDSQIKACQDIAKQLSQNFPSHHVVQGEVGSGKTLVAAYALTNLAYHNHQAIYLAPTTILSQQHFETISPIAKKLNLSCELWTANQKSDSQAQILIGTHALIQPNVNLKPSLVISDEEHRFGVAQREFFWQFSPKPHLISMTATPIPRTLAKIMFTQDSVSYLTGIPGKEQKIKTRVFPHQKLADHFSWLQKQVLTDHIQAFLIAPFISPSQVPGFENISSAQELYLSAKKAMPKIKIAVLTGQQSVAEKNKILEKMHQDKIDVLVATPVVEVGIDLPKAAVITITSAERFGLAQLHQLRGRVGRQGQPGWCFLVPSQNTDHIDRLKQLESITDGQRLAELDLKSRGVGEFIGTKQSGWNTLEIATWFDLQLIEQVKRLQNQIKLVQ
jgi:ATP-dependent DNA helicase RecG